MDARARWRILRLHVEDQVPLARLARETDVGLRTLERWHARYRADGYAGLETASRADAGSRRLPPDLVDLIEGLALSKPRPAIATIHRKVTGICAARRWPVPSYSVVWDIVRTLDPGMVTLALGGAASYRDKHELVLRRQAELPNAMWQSDHTMLDILVVGTDGKPARPWLRTILDDCSRAVCGYTVFLGASSLFRVHESSSTRVRSSPLCSASRSSRVDARERSSNRPRRPTSPLFNPHTSRELVS